MCCGYGGCNYLEEHFGVPCFQSFVGLGIFSVRFVNSLCIDIYFFPPTNNHGEIVGLFSTI